MLSLPSATPDVLYLPPPDLGLDLVYEDEAMLVVDKPAGLLSVPGRGPDRQDCLASRVGRRFPEALVVHRLDMATSGLLLMARGQAMQSRLSALFQSRQVDKTYVALVHGLLPSAAGTVDLPLITDWPRRPMQKVCHAQGKPSVTHYEVLAQDPERGMSRVALTPVTGRSHQLRVHMLALGHPIVGDPLYGERALQEPHARLMLHAQRLSLPHPVTGAPIEVCSAAPF